MSYVGWPTNVNKSVLDNAQLTVGEGATKEDTLETGKKQGRLTVSNAPKKFSVTMRFNYDERDSRGLTEKDRFWNWYERVLKYSTNEFQFPNLMYGIDSDKLCWYRILGAVNGAKSGLDQEVQMTWESVYEGEIEADFDEPFVSRIEAEDGAVTVFYTGIPSTSPTTNSFGALMIDGVQTPLTAFRYFDNDRCYLYFNKIKDGAAHTAYFSLYPDLTDSFRAEQDDGGD